MRRRGSPPAAVGAAAGAVLLVASLSACIAPDVEVVGALGLTVDEEARPVIVVEACDGAAAGVDLSFDREGLSADEENEVVASWTPLAPVGGTSQLALHAPADPWQGEGVDLSLDRGYVVTAVGDGDRDVLTQVAFRGSDLAGLEPGTVYGNEADPDATALVARTPAEFTAAVCGRN